VSVCMCVVELCLDLCDCVYVVCVWDLCGCLLL